jgi:hypothetical protein
MPTCVHDLRGKEWSYKLTKIQGSETTITETEKGEVGV